MKYQGTVTLGYAVQEGNYAQVNAKTGKKLTVFEIYDFAANYLKTEAFSKVRRLLKKLP